MMSHRQLATNRNNALLSTGPKSQEGKQISAKNSLKHGILSKALLLKDESQAELEKLKQSLHMSLAPVGYLEELLVDKIISTVWRLTRLTRAETAIFDSGSFEWSMSYNGLIEAFKEKGSAQLQSLSRYESALERSFYKALHELQRLQSMRMGGGLALAPIAIDINTGDSDNGFVS